MDARELQIGDWVRIKEPNTYAGNIGKILSLVSHKENEGAYFSVFHFGEMGAGNADVFSDDIQPITLTEDILVKSGFEKSQERYLYNEYRMCLNEGTDKERWLFIEYHHTSGYIKLMYQNYAGHEDSIGSITLNDCMVHQLQQIFRIFRIDINLKP